MKTTKFTLASLTKCIHPHPVYEAHFADGTVRRMSFWQRDGKPWDFDSGQRTCTLGPAWNYRAACMGRAIPRQPAAIPDGYIFHGDKLVRDPAFNGQPFYAMAATVSEPVKPKRKTVKLYRDALAAMLNGQPGAAEQAQDLIAPWFRFRLPMLRPGLGHFLDEVLEARPCVGLDFDLVQLRLLERHCHA